MLSKSANNTGRDWDTKLPYVLYAYRVSVHPSTDLTDLMISQFGLLSIALEDALSRCQMINFIPERRIVKQILHPALTLKPCLHYAVKPASKRDKCKLAQQDIVSTRDSLNRFRLR